MACLSPNDSWSLTNSFLLDFPQVLHRFLTPFSLVPHNFLTGFSQLSHRFHWGFSEVSHNFLTGFSQVSQRFLTGFSQLFSEVFLCFSLWSLMTSHWFPKQVSHNFSQLCHSFLNTQIKDFHSFPMDFTQLSHRFLTAFSQVSQRFLKGFPMFLPCFSQVSHDFLTNVSQTSQSFCTGFSQLSHRFLTAFSQVSPSFLTGFSLVSQRSFRAATHWLVSQDFAGLLTDSHRFPTDSSQLSHRFLTASLTDTRQPDSIGQTFLTEPTGSCLTDFSPKKQFTMSPNDSTPTTVWKQMSQIWTNMAIPSINPGGCVWLFFCYTETSQNSIIITLPSVWTILQPQPLQDD